MSDRFQETTTKSWGARLSASLGGIVFGLIALIAIPWLLFWNEGRAVQTAKSLAEGAGLVQSVPRDRVEARNAGRLVHVSGDLKVTGTLVDPVTGVSAVAVRLKRKAEMFQWVETCSSTSERKLGGSEETVTTCKYLREWKEGREASEQFRQPQGHDNPKPGFASARVSQSRGRLGAFTAEQKVLDRLSGSDPLVLSEAIMKTVRGKLVDGSAARAKGNTIYVAGLGAPRIGDMRLTMTTVGAGPSSVVGQQTAVEGRTALRPFQTRAGDALLLVGRGEVPAAAMFEQAEKANATITWILRLIGVIFLFAGIAFMLRPLAVLADVVPVFGTVVRFGTNSVAGIAALLIGGLTIGIAWIWYRPLIGLAVMAIAALLAAMLWWRGARRAEGRPNKESGIT